MLFTDRDFVTIDDIVAIDPDVAEVSSVENIPTEGDGSFCHQAIEEAANTIMEYMQNFGYYFGASAVTQQVYLFPTYDSTPPARITLNQIVVDSDNTTYWSPLKRWVVYLALRNFYQIVSNRKIDDKYDKKLQQIQKDIDNKYFPAFKSAGVPVAYTPVDCPGSKYTINSGIWNNANVTTTSGGTAAAGDYDVAITWVNTVGESGPSETSSIHVDANNVLTVSIASLNPPGMTTTSTDNQSPDTESTPTLYWNIYAGVTDGPLYFQAQVSIANKTYTFSGAPVNFGTLVGRGQTRDVEMTMLNSFFRG